MRIAIFVELPEPFEPSTDDWHLYTQCFNHFFLANRVDDNSKQCHLILALISNSTFNLLTNLVAPSKFVNSYRNTFHRNQ